MTTTHRISTTAALILSLATLGAPAASARSVGLDAATAANGQSSTAVRGGWRSCRRCYGLHGREGRAPGPFGIMPG